MDLPKFRYFPDPISERSIIPSENTCIVCQKQRGYIYTSHVAPVEYHDCICPWCIADGSAHQKLGVSFNDDEFVGGGSWEQVSQEIIDEIVFRTPSFHGWQQEKWFTHCGDAAAFLGRVGYIELMIYGDEAIEAIRDNTGILDDEEWQWFFRALDKDESPRGYLFRCLHCGQYGGYQDCD